MVVKNDYSRYFFNNLYDDEIITNKLADYQNNMYDPILRGKSWIQNNRIINGDITDIQVNSELNDRFGIPKNTYSIFLNINIVPYYSEKDFYFKYGYETPISTSQIMEDDKIFGKYIYFFMSGYLIHNVELVVLKGGYTILFIHPTTTDKAGDIHEKDLEEIMTGVDEDGLWTVMFSTRSDVYRTRKQRALLFSENKIYLKNLSVYKKYNRPNKNNCYTLYITAFPNSYNIMTACTATAGVDGNGEYFEIPEEFRDYIYKKANMLDCMIINEPDCSGSGIYVDSKGSEPIFQIPYNKNPIPIKNLLIWQYDWKTKRKIHPLEVSTTIHYPNIYDFSEMVEASYYTYLCDKSKAFIVDANRNYIILCGESNDPNYDLYIEWVEPEHDCMVFNSYIQDYIDYDDDYCDKMYAGDLPEEFSNFDPVSRIGLGSFDYFKSEYYDDYRAWRLSAISQILHNNPRKYDEFYHEIYTKIRSYLTRCYTYKDNQDIYDRVIENNYDHCVNDRENRMTFKTPHTYLHIRDYYEEEKPFSVYIGGKLIDLSFVMKRGTTLYAYIDRRYIEYNESIQVDLETLNNYAENAKIYINSVGDPVDLEILNFKQSHSLSDLVFYDKDGNYLNPDDFTLQAQIKTTDFSYKPPQDELDNAHTETTELYMSDGSQFIPYGSDGLILRSTELELDLTIMDTVKDVNIADIKMIPKNEKLCGTHVGIGTTDFSRRRIYHITDDINAPELYDCNNLQILTKDLEVIVLQPTEGAVLEDHYDISFGNFKGKPSNERFKVYANGKLISPSDYTVTFEGYNKDCIFTFTTDFNGMQLNIHYSAYDDELIFDGLASSLLKTDHPVLFLRDILTTPYDKYVYKIFIDGYRISDDQIFTLGQSNMLYIKKLIDKDSSVLIFRQKMDTQIYGYEKDVQFLDITCQNDPNFLSYLIDKYTA